MAMANLPLNIASSRFGALRRTVLPMLVVIAVVLVPLLGDTSHFVDNLLHSNTIPIAVGVVVLLMSFVMIQWKPATLTMDQLGIGVTGRDTDYLYRWADIDSTATTKSGVQINVRGQSDLRKKYNVVLCQNFGLLSGDFSNLVDAGRQQYATASAGAGARRSVTPGDDAASAIRDAASSSIRLLAFGLCLALAALTLWQLTEYRTAVALRDHGQRATATVVRFYSSECGKRGCSRDVEYVFDADPTGTAHLVHGHAFIANTNRASPDYDTAKVQGQVPIVFDTRDPTSSQLNFGDRVFRRDPADVAMTMMKLISGVFGAMFVIFIIAIKLSSWSNRRKLAAEGRSVAA